MNTPHSQTADTDSTPRLSSFVAGCLTMVAWSVLGLTIGVGGGYFLYVKKPAEFQSVAVLQVQHQATTDTDDSQIILSDPVLNRAVSEHRLDRLPSLQAPGANRNQNNNKKNNPPARDVISQLRRHIKLQRRPLAAAAPDAIYEVQCHAASSSDSEAIANAVVSSYVQYLSATDNQTAWKSAIELLQSARNESLERIAELEKQRVPLKLPANASLEAGEVISAEAVRWDRLRSESARFHEEYIQANAQIQRTESLITEGAAADDILAALGMSVDAAPTTAPAADASADASAVKAAEQQKRILAERAKIRADVERDLVPLNQELDRLLKIVASEHPKVRGVQKRIDKVLERLNDMPPLPKRSPSAGQPKTQDTARQETTGPSKGTLVTARLRALRTRRDQLGQQMSDVDAQLKQAAERVSKQKTELQEDARFRREITLEQQLADRATEQLETILRTPPEPATQAAVVSLAEPGVQVTPHLGPHLLIGAAAGVLLGLVLGGLFLLTSAAGEPEGDGA
ncbi:GumC domain-containing protein [Roseimaritima ulvae]|nr:hypothetical protein [Roseimaritima ulvae]